MLVLHIAMHQGRVVVGQQHFELLPVAAQVGSAICMRMQMPHLRSCSTDTNPLHVTPKAPFLMHMKA